MAIYPRTLPDLPDESAFFSGGTVSQGELSALVNRITHQAGRRARRWSTTIVKHNDDLAFMGYPPQPNGTAASEYLRILLPTSELSSHLYLALDVVGLPSRVNGAYADPLVNASLYYLSGTLIDIGIEWSQNNGNFTPPDAGQAAEEDCTNMILTSGVRINDPEAIGPTAGAPRLLSLGSAGGSEIELRVLCDSTLVLSVSVLEWWEPTI
jgi:hypothetical protein